MSPSRRKKTYVTCANCGARLRFGMGAEGYDAPYSSALAAPPERVHRVVDPENAGLTVMCATCGHFTVHEMPSRQPESDR